MTCCCWCCCCWLARAQCLQLGHKIDKGLGNCRASSGKWRMESRAETRVPKPTPQQHQGHRMCYSFDDNSSAYQTRSQTHTRTHTQTVSVRSGNIQCEANSINAKVRDGTFYASLRIHWKISRRAKKQTKRKKRGTKPKPKATKTQTNTHSHAHREVRALVSSKVCYKNIKSENFNAAAASTAAASKRVGQKYSTGPIRRRCRRWRWRWRRRRWGGLSAEVASQG